MNKTPWALSESWPHQDSLGFWDETCTSTHDHSECHRCQLQAALCVLVEHLETRVTSENGMIAFLGVSEEGR